ncbi:hypothetical protein HGRIS_013623 [Hohenbuehelia grisea]|uniref:Uncharacterized protein n=1 Tax=Hohenbuehelia grisea TaxID=104357 RepID=A0ABR3IW42_9AGAR
MLAVHHNQSILHAPSNNSLTSSSSSSTTSRTDINDDNRRPRIRFAPLPDPRREVLITDDGDELPLPTHSTSIPVPPLLAELNIYRQNKLNSPLPSIIPLEYDNASINSNSTKRSSGGCGAGDSTSTGATTPCTSESVSSLNTLDVNSLPAVSEEPQTPKQQPQDGEKKHKSWGSKTFLRPFIRKPSLSSVSLASSPSASSSTSTLTPRLSSAFSRLNISTPTISLFRSSSRHSAGPHDHSHDKLSRWTSSSSSSTAPLARTQSLTDDARRRPSSMITGSFPPAHTHIPKRPSTANSLSSPMSPPRKGKGTRMLNGRVYGHRRPPNANPFANARDEADPEFVEWGYGGMGSVRNGAAGNHMWSRLQRSGVVVGQDSNAATSGGGDSDDMDDGSGMGWVRRRREQRERERAEAAAVAAASGESPSASGTAPAESPSANDTTSTGPAAAAVSENTTQTGPADPDAGVSAAPCGPVGGETHTGGDGEKDGEGRGGGGDEQAVVEEAKVSAKVGLAESERVETPAEKKAHESEAPQPPHPHLSDEHNTRAVTVPAPLPQRRGSHHRSISRPSTSEGELHTPRAEKPVVLEDSVARGRDRQVRAEESETDDDESPERSNDGDGDDEEEDDEDDEDEEEGEAELARKTALGAGVEKISRHNGATTAYTP